MANTKYPRTYHFPFLPGATSDDKIVDNGWFEYLKVKEMVISEIEEMCEPTMFKLIFIGQRVGNKQN